MKNGKFLLLPAFVFLFSGRMMAMNWHISGELAERFANVEKGIEVDSDLARTSKLIDMYMQEISGEGGVAESELENRFTNLVDHLDAIKNSDGLNASIQFLEYRHYRMENKQHKIALLDLLFKVNGRIRKMELATLVSNGTPAELWEIPAELWEILSALGKS